MREVLSNCEVLQDVWFKNKLFMGEGANPLRSHHCAEFMGISSPRLSSKPVPW